MVSKMHIKQFRISGIWIFVVGFCAVMFALICVKINEIASETESKIDNINASKQGNEKQPIKKSKFGYNPGVYYQKGICTKNNAPWSNAWIKKQIRPFLQVYNRRPANNYLGTPLMHQFAMWCIVRYLEPLHIIESGIWRGLGTWLLRQAAPHSQLILLDVRIKRNIIYKDLKNDTLYLTGRNFTDFSRLNSVNGLKLNLDRTLAFIDDHHSPFLRIPHARKSGIKHMIFEDNYWLGFYDCLSLKQGCACVMGESICQTFQYKDAYGLIKRNMTMHYLKKIERTFEGIDTYSEFPMMWNVYKDGVTMISKKSRNYLFDARHGEQLLKDYGLKWFPEKSMLDGSYTYCNIAYVKLKY